MTNGVVMKVVIDGKLFVPAGDVKNPARQCEWRGKFSYATGCDKEFFDASESGNPVTDWLNYCPYCGGRVVIK